MGCNMLAQLVGNVLVVLCTVKGEPQMVCENPARSSVCPLAVLCMVKWHYSGSFHDSSILPFCNPILLWIIRSGQLSLNP